MCSILIDEIYSRKKREQYTFAFSHFIVMLTLKLGKGLEKPHVTAKKGIYYTL